MEFTLNTVEVGNMVKKYLAIISFGFDCNFDFYQAVHAPNKYKSGK